MEIYTGKIFQSGGSQALRIPNACRFPEGVDEVGIISQGDKRIITGKRKSLVSFYLKEHDKVDKSFMKDREDLPPEEKELF